jgi:hypothetical protein
MNVAGYIIAYSDDTYDGPSIIALNDMLDVNPREIHRTIEAAEKRVSEIVKEMPLFSQALYGEVFPFENTSMKNEIEKKGFGLYGWYKDVFDDGSVVQYGVYIMALKWS